jgi:hypothetical protein
MSVTMPQVGRSGGKWSKVFQHHFSHLASPAPYVSTFQAFRGLWNLQAFHVRYGMRCFAAVT